MFDVQANEAKSRFDSIVRSARRLVYGKNVLNLKPGLWRRRPWVTAALMIALVTGIFWSARKISTHAEVKDFFPLTCLGSWQSPANAQGNPESLNASNTPIDSTNASAYDPTNPLAQIYCGAFVPPDFATQGDVTSVGLSFIWYIPGLPSSTPVAPVNATPAAATSSTDSSTIAAPPSTSMLFFINRALADDVAPPPDTSTVIVAPDASTNLTATDAGSATDNGGGASAPAPTPAPLPPVTAPAPIVNENFLKVSYSLDGQTWAELAEVSPENWQNFTANLPVKSWDDLKKLQVKIEGTPTVLTQIPRVLLDGMFIETHYEVAPSLPSLDIGQQNSGDVNAPVLVLPPGAQPVPVNDRTDFKANEAPAFDFDLNALPAPPEPAATSSPPDVTPASSPSSFLEPAQKAALALFGLFGIRAHAQTAPNLQALPDANNTIVTQILGPDAQPTNLQAATLVTGGNLRVILPTPGRVFRPGAYTLKLLIWQNGTIYMTESNFNWGVLAVNFNKSIYTLDDVAKIGFGVLDDAGRTVCNAAIDMDVTAPSGALRHFSTSNRTIVRSASCGPGTVTNNPDYTAHMQVAEQGVYRVSITATTINGTHSIDDQFQGQAQPSFDVERVGPTRIFPPVWYTMVFNIKANADYSGPVVETVPASFDVMPNQGGTKAISGDTQTITWNVNLRHGSSTLVSYSWKGPNVSPELYRLGPFQIGSWQESREWQIASDAITDTVIFITSTASTSWPVPNDWNNSSSSIEVIGAGGGGTKNTGSTSKGAAGGGGGAYAKTTNASTTLTIGTNAGVHVGAGGAASTTGGDTWFCSATTNCGGIASTSVVVGAKGGGGALAGNPGTAGSGGATSTSVGSTKFIGGTGGNGTTTNTTNGAGGGGAAGYHAAGGNGTNAGGSGVVGGAGDGGTGNGGGAGGSTGNPATAGGNGTEWTANPGGGTAGSGGGGGGGNANGVAGASGGNYGGGGGGGRGSGSTGGSGIQGLIVIVYTPVTITLGDGTQPAAQTIAPSANSATGTVFTFQTNFGTSSISNLTLTVATTTGVSQFIVTDSTGATVYGSSTNPASTSLNVTTTNMNVSTTATTFNVMVKPLSYASMPNPPDTQYVVTSTVSAWTDSKSLDQAGGNTTSSPITIDNKAPADVAGATATGGNGQVTLSWTNPGDSDFSTTTVLRATSTVTQSPSDGTNYAVGNTIGTSTVACVVNSAATGCTDTGLTNGTAYSYKIFTSDSRINYSPGVVPSGSPVTPNANSAPTVSNAKLNGNSNIVLSPNTTATITVVASTTDADGPGDIKYATSTIYRTALGSTCTADNKNCYQIASSSCSFSGSTSTVSCSADIYYFAQATDASSTFNSDTWSAVITVHDAADATGATTSPTVELQTLLALNITTSSIAYGTLTPSSTSGGSITTTVQVVGNCSTTLQLTGSAFVKGSDTLATSSQHFATSSFTVNNGSDTAISDTALSVAGFLLVGPTSSNAVQSNVFWGIAVPTGKPTGTYTATTTFTAVWSQ